ncbi:MAG TPA: LysM peptidoglycan-binding domain-containing protein [Nitrospiria bacterium]|jgi:nucleoid-associated protein YgaU|nr:LysM peptidoglycan-binding domain-containing protein [Nitrospiria bacterium]
MMYSGRRWLSFFTFVGVILVTAPSVDSTGWGQETPSTATSNDQGSTQETPATTQETPATTQETPATTQEIPATTQETPATTQETPATTQETSAPQEKAPTSEPGTVTVPETTAGPGKYTVKPGDTLWDITNTFLQDSFLWPKVWNHNQYIINPDLIYPGNVIVLPGGEEAKVEAPVVTPQPATAPPPKEEKEGVEAAAPAKQAEMPVEIAPHEQPVPAAEPIEMKFLAASGYILSGQGSAGTVVGAMNNRELIGEGDTAYLLPKEGSAPRIGDQYTIYRAVRKVYHPKTGTYMGELIRILGQTKITGADPKEKTVTSKVLTSYDYIQPGDFVMPASTEGETAEHNTYTSPGGQLDGFIVEAKENRASQAQFDVVYLDRGRQQGVHSGDRFRIDREGEKTSFISPGGGVRLPRRVIGELQVIAVQDSTATAQIVKSTEVIYKGDHFETPPAP